MRIGSGYDVHRLTEGRKLILGGVEIPFEKGLLGHSDADVLVHAVMDALLGAAALGDIGKHFPDTDPAYKGADSMRLLKEVRRLIEEKAYFIENIDATVIAQRPKLAGYIPQMKKNIADVLGLSEEQVNVKATTEEGLGFTGEGLGIAASAVCLLSEIQNYVGADVMFEERNCAGCQGCRQSDHGQQYQHQSHMPYQRCIFLYDSIINDRCHNQRHKQFKTCLQ